MSDCRLISIICPVFNEEESVPLFYKRLQTVLNPLRNRYDFELIFTNNCSTDGTLEVISDLRKDNPEIQILTFSRNFGYQASVKAGLTYASGDAIIVIDVDCEDPPEMIEVFIKEWENNFDIVYGERVQRQEFYGIHLMRKLFYRINYLVADSDIILDMAEFFLISSHVRDAILNNHSTYPFLRTEVGFVGYRKKGIPYQRKQRLQGKTHYSFIGMAEFAIGGILSSSTFPLRLAAYLCPLLMLVNILYLFYEVWKGIQRYFHLLIILDFLYLIFFVAFICIYLARTYKDEVARPTFIIDKKYSTLGNESYHKSQNK